MGNTRGKKNVVLLRFLAISNNKENNNYNICGIRLMHEEYSQTPRGQQKD